MTPRLYPAVLLCTSLLAAPRLASAQQWWNPAWPYRVPVTADGSGTVEVAIDFGALLDSLGLNHALLDLRSVRVVPYDGSTALDPVPYAETYSVLVEDGEEPQLEWSDSGVYWTINDGELDADRARASEGEGSVRALIQNLPGGYGYPGVELHIADGDPRSDWRNFETFLYDVWPEVNDSALDQAPDLYYFKVYDTNGCDSGSVTQGGPPLAPGRWNPATVSLNPLSTCTTPELSDITRLELHTRDNDTVNGRSGLYDDGDELTLWLDNIRLVDQNSGRLEWHADGSTSSYYVYFDVVEHEGHPAPELTTAGKATITATLGDPEAGGYLHRISGADEAGLEIWTAPAIEKILPSHAVPSHAAPLQIQAAKNELEPFVILVRAPSAQPLPVSVSDFVSDAGTLPSSSVTLHRVDTVPLSELSDHYGRIGDWPDPLYPIAMGSSVAFPSGKNQALWFTVRIPEQARAGRYQATVSVGEATVPLELEVWDFALPNAIDLAGEWGFGWSNVVERYQGTIDGDVQPCYWDLVDALYQDFADHRLVPKGVGWPAGLNYPGGVEYDCKGKLDPQSWGEWGFSDLAAAYLDGGRLSYGFPSFLIDGPASNWPPDSRPDSFCGEQRGTDPPGNTAYNERWFEYWGAVSDYLEQSEYADRGYYHIVNEPQTFEDYDIAAYLAQQTKAAAPNVRILLSEQVEPLIYDNPTYPGSKIDIWMPTITNYEPDKSHDRQLNHGEQVWWYFLYGDRPPLPNPTVIDRTGLEARIIPWLAWAERVDGLLYYKTTEFGEDPWTQPWLYDGNGDGFMFYPPKDDTIAFDACDAQSNRLVPSIRWELLREGMEDYAYLALLNGGRPAIGTHDTADAFVDDLVQSRTRFSRVPTDVYATRAKIAVAITGVDCADECDEGMSCDGVVLNVCARGVGGCLRLTTTDCGLLQGGSCDAEAGECRSSATGAGGSGSGGGAGSVTGGSSTAGGSAAGGSGGAATGSTSDLGAAGRSDAGRAGSSAEGWGGDGNATGASDRAGAASVSEADQGSGESGCGCRVAHRPLVASMAWWAWLAVAVGMRGRRSTTADRGRTGANRTV
ncbi:MAG: DUF4091 domain-containing protein [Polyangiaceae bacterium]|nr:DUF4091 domain-containing protein [Polyangiaceae bacterium]